jgi:hypothetical protein
VIALTGLVLPLAQAVFITDQNYVAPTPLPISMPIPRMTLTSILNEKSFQYGLRGKKRLPMCSGKHMLIKDWDFNRLGLLGAQSVVAEDRVGSTSWKLIALKSERGTRAEN